jgi:hypothetical protein
MAIFIGASDPRSFGGVTALVGLADAAEPADDVAAADGVMASDDAVAADGVAADVFVPAEAAWACKLKQRVALAMAIRVFMVDALFEVSLIVVLTIVGVAIGDFMISWPFG